MTVWLMEYMLWRGGDRLAEERFAEARQAAALVAAARECGFGVHR